MRLLVRGGTLVSAADMREASLLCEDGRIAAVLEPDDAPGAVDEVVDAAGMLVFPGFIDPHVHSRDPGLTEKETFAHATRAAAGGGVTCIFDMPNTSPPLARPEQVAQRAEAHLGQAHVDFGLWGIALGAENLAELPGLVRAGVVGVKLFWSYEIGRHTGKLGYGSADMPDENLVVPPDNADVLDIFRAVGAAGGLLAAHCEDRALVLAGERSLGRPPERHADLLELHPEAAEPAAIALGIEFARVSGCAFHVVHVSTARGVELVRRAQADGIPISAETCPHYLTLTSDDAEAIGPLAKIFPPIRLAQDQQAIWAGVQDGTIAFVGSDHAPHTAEEKQRPLATQPAGFVGVETLGPLLVDEMSNGRLTPQQLAGLLSEGAARRFGLYPRKGSLQPGADADLTLVDPETRWTLRNELLHSKHPLSPWHGRELVGRPRLTLLGGHVVMRDGEVDGPPRGRFVSPVDSRVPATVGASLP